MKTRVVFLALLGMAISVSAQQGPAGRLKHIVVIFQENVSFDHYFATYPHALNPPGEPAFHALAGTPAVDGLSGALLTNNPNKTNPANGANAANPFRLDRSQAATADQDHRYRAEQLAFDHGKMDLFPEYTGRRGPPPGEHPPAGLKPPLTTQGLVMGYYDGNTVTALWNYAQHYALSDHYFGTTFGPSTVGALNLVSGQTNGVSALRNGDVGIIAGGAGTLTDINDSDPLGDVCSHPSYTQFSMGGRNIGNLLTAAKVSWGWFQGGFDLQTVNPDGSTGCRRQHYSAIVHRDIRDYVPHHDPFQYYASTANPQHLRPTSVAMIGREGGRANHNYDMQDFFTAVKAGNFPQVSFLKAPQYENGHAGNSDPLDGQRFIVGVLNFLEQQKQWGQTAVIVTYDDSDGWYDHVPSPIVNGSRSSEDAYTAPGVCGDGTPQLGGIAVTQAPPNTTFVAVKLWFAHLFGDAAQANAHAEGRCGYGPRLPLLVISPWARANFVAHNVTDQTSILRLIEDTFLHGERIGGGSFDSISGSLDPLFDFTGAVPHNTRRLLLNPATGEPEGKGRVSEHPDRGRR